LIHDKKKDVIKNLFNYNYDIQCNIISSPEKEKDKNF